MKKKKSEQGIALVWVILAGILLITGVEMVISRKQAQVIKKGEQISQPDGTKKEIEGKGEKFVGKIEEIIAKDAPMKCTYAQEGFTGVSFIKGKKMYSEVSIEEGATTYTIIRDNCMWNWGWAGNQGTKICFEEDVWQVSETVPVGAEPRCIPATLADSRFEPPADIIFMATGETGSLPLNDESLLKILPPKERAELESAIKQGEEIQQMLDNIDQFPADFFDPSNLFKGLNEINKQTQEQIEKNIEKQQQEFQPIDTKKIEDYFNQNPPAFPHEEKGFSPEEQEYYYRKYILKDPAFQY